MNTSELYPVDSRVVVQSRRGLEIGRVRGEGQASSHSQKGGVILRLATTEELSTWEELAQKAEDLKWFLRARARARGLQVKIVAVEFTLDASLVTLSYSAEERIELSSLIADVRTHTSARVNFCAVGPREQAMHLGALGACGRESCSSTHLQDFAPVSIRMARDQQLPLNPEKLSGPCGRLLCCLQFEHSMYQELLAELPRKGTKACHTDSGACGKIIKVNPLAGTVALLTDEGQTLEARPEELSRR
ncbi:cell fate regulator YaaT (PSP1 superfamily) [Deinobacterium chartae]|uniref:Cell fate regulator YaaT (PSP1 superfamily) n=1 Tax=Deinobacterium chartae TaxID=521158 RepID=A0A841I166_9DEIO|nr:regulatory iron-sulfur-containing complex subunit RicT [Deinobacterium chartae]MBB6098149.1 cell fate regulator YaaT (PSP1 superfamily) [Deinobacterium chartae]